MTEKKRPNKKLTPEIEREIVNIYEANKDEEGYCEVWKIASELMPLADLSITTINKVITEYCEYMKIPKKLKCPVKTPQMPPIENIEEELIKQLKKGRPAKNVYKIAVKMNALTPTLKEILKKDYNIDIKENDGEER